MQIDTYKKVKVSFFEWSPVYLDVAKVLIEFINIDELEIVHIGSTSFGVGGKGIIDLMVLYKNHNLKLAVSHLLNLGFQKQIGDKPFPEHRPRLDGKIVYQGKEYFLHVHVIKYGCKEHEQKLAYNYHMLSNDDARKAYEYTKKQILADGITEQDSYGDHKSPFIKSVLKNLDAI